MICFCFFCGFFWFFLWIQCLSLCHLFLCVIVSWSHRLLVWFFFCSRTIISPESIDEPFCQPSCVFLFISFSWGTPRGHRWPSWPVPLLTDSAELFAVEGSSGFLCAVCLGAGEWDWGVVMCYTYKLVGFFYYISGGKVRSIIICGDCGSSTLWKYASACKPDHVENERQNLPIRRLMALMLEALTQIS